MTAVTNTRPQWLNVKQGKTLTLQLWGLGIPESPHSVASALEVPEDTVGTERHRALVWGEGRAQSVSYFWLFRQSGQLTGSAVHGGGIRVVRQTGEGQMEKRQ